MLNLKRKVSFKHTPPTSPAPNYASAAKSQPSAPVLQTSRVSTMPAAPGILHNKLGQRVDSTLSYIHPALIYVENQKLCSSFYLFEWCRHGGEGKCIHEHKPALNSVQIKALRALVRRSPCRFGFACIEEDCLQGHRCPWKFCLGNPTADSSRKCTMLTLRCLVDARGGTTHLDPLSILSFSRFPT